MPVSPKEFAHVFDAIPAGVKLLISYQISPMSIILCSIGNSDPFISLKTKNKHINEIRHRNNISTPASILLEQSVF